MSETISLRPAAANDADLLLEWRNNPETRAASHNIVEIQRDEHLAWFTKTLTDVNRKLYIAHDKGTPVGTVRADLSDGVYTLSWTVSPLARGNGVGRRMVGLLASQISAPIRAEIKSGNSKSILVAEHVGMKLEREQDGVLYYRRQPLI